MRGERRTWYRLADRLGVPLQELQRKTTSTEFLEWQRHLEMEAEEEFDRELRRVTKEEHYLAQIALEVFNCFRSQRAGTLEDFLFKFHRPDKPEEAHQPRKKTAKQIAAETERSKNFWTALVQDGVKPPPQLQSK